MLRTANQIRASQSFTFSFFRNPPPHPIPLPPSPCLHPPASNSVKFTAAAAYVSDNNALHCCAELSSQPFVFFDLCDRWGTHFFFCTRSHRRLLLDGPAPGWWPLRSSWCQRHRGRAWVRAFTLSLSFLFFLSPLRSRSFPDHLFIFVHPYTQTWSSPSNATMTRSLSKGGGGDIFKGITSIHSVALPTLSRAPLNQKAADQVII